MNEGLPEARSARLACRLAYLAVVVIATLAQLHFDPDPSEVAERFDRAFTFSVQARDVVDAIRNIALFGGLGAVWMLTSRARRDAVAVLDAAVVGCVSSAAVETLQLFSPVRVASALDVVTDTVGAALGALSVLALAYAIRGQRRRAAIAGAPMLAFAGAYVGACVAEALVPHLKSARHTFRNGIFGRLELAVDELRLASIVDVPWLDVALFFPAGALACAALAENRVAPNDARRYVGVAGFVVMAAAELAHGAIGYPIVLGSAFGHGLAIMLGAAAYAPLAALAGRLDERGRAARLAAVYAAFVALWSWRPFALRGLRDVAAQLSADHLVPMLAQTESSGVYAVGDGAIQFLLYLPLGCLFAVWPVRERGWLAHVLPALYLALLVEGGQIFVADRYFDTTDLVIDFAGAAIGWTVTRWAGFVVKGDLLGRPDSDRVSGRRA